MREGFYKKQYTKMKEHGYCRHDRVDKEAFSYHWVFYIALDPNPANLHLAVQAIAPLLEQLGLIFECVWLGAMPTKEEKQQGEQKEAVPVKNKFTWAWWEAELDNPNSSPDLNMHGQEFCVWIGRKTSTGKYEISNEIIKQLMVEILEQLILSKVKFTYAPPHDTRPIPCEPGICVPFSYHYRPEKADNTLPFGLLLEERYNPRNVEDPFQKIFFTKADIDKIARSIVGPYGDNKIDPAIKDSLPTLCTAVEMEKDLQARVKLGQTKLAAIGSAQKQVLKASHGLTTTLECIEGLLYDRGISPEQRIAQINAFVLKLPRKRHNFKILLEAELFLTTIKSGKVSEIADKFLTLKQTVILANGKLVADLSVIPYESDVPELSSVDIATIFVEQDAAAMQLFFCQYTHADREECQLQFLQTMIAISQILRNVQLALPKKFAAILTALSVETFDIHNLYRAFDCLLPLFDPRKNENNKELKALLTEFWVKLSRVGKQKLDIASGVRRIIYERAQHELLFNAPPEPNQPWDFFGWFKRDKEATPLEYIKAERQRLQFG